MKNKILLCGPRPKGAMSGVALAFELLAEGLKGRNFKVAVVDATFRGAVAKSGTFSLARAFETVAVILAVWWHLLSSRVYYATMSTSTVGFIRDYLTVGFAKLLGRRTILHLHGGGFSDFYIGASPWLQRLIRSNLRRTDAIIVLGELLKEQFYCVGEFVKPKLLVVPNGLTLGVEEPEGRTKHLPEAGQVELLYLSSLMPSKGFFDVLKAMVTLEQNHPGRYHLNLCGSFVDAKTEYSVAVSDEESLYGFVESSGFRDCVTFYGQVLDAAKEEQFLKAQVFLLPTSYPWEGQPLSIIEALAYAIPVISCYHKGIPELVEEGETGLFVEPMSPDSIASAVIRLTQDPENYSKMSESAREHYEANFRREVHLDRLISTILG